MIIGFKDPAKLLYHYTKASTAKDKILPGRSLKLGCFDRTNDPKEMRQWSFNMQLGPEGDSGPSNLTQLSAELTHELKAWTKIACFCQDRGPLTGDHTQDILLRGHTLPRMWAQYAERHTGVCLVFERDKLAKQIVQQIGTRGRVFVGSVHYRDIGFIENMEDPAFTIHGPLLKGLGMRAYSRLHREKFAAKFFLEKAEDWKNEREYRFIAYVEEPGDVFIDYGDALVGLFLGDAVAREDLQAILGLTDDLKVERMGMRWSNSCPWYDFGTLTYSREPGPWNPRKRKAVPADSTPA